jgi:alginate production protein
MTARLAAQSPVPRQAAPTAGVQPPLAASAVPAAASLARRPDDREADAPLSVTVLGQPIVLSMSYELTQERRLNFDLEGRQPNDRDVTEHELKLDARWHDGHQTTLFVQAVALAERRRDRGDGSVQTEQSYERGQAWWLRERIAGLPLSLQIGRIALIDRRAWWWDDDLDALRLSYTSADRGDWAVETGLGRELLKRSSLDRGIAPDQRGVMRWFGQARWGWREDHLLEAYWLWSRDRSGTPAAGRLFDEDTEDERDARLTWLGLRSSGQWRPLEGHRLNYRADLAWLGGRHTVTPFEDADNGQLVAGASRSRRVRAHAWDLGAQWRWPGDARPTLSLGLAHGSGGASAAALDTNFRQTGLQENKGRVGGVKRWRYYGELLDPELSNLTVASLGFGLRAWGNNSVDLLWHHYRQDVAASTLLGSRLSADPLGRHRDIGQEIDLLLALRQWDHLELTLKLARFLPGRAFAADQRDPAHSIELGAVLTF